MKIAILAPESMGNYILETAQKYFSDIEILLFFNKISKKNTFKHHLNT